MKRTSILLLLSLLILTSCLKKSTNNETKEQAFSLSELYPTKPPSSAKEAGRFTFTGNIAETDFSGGLFVVRTVDGNVGLKFDPKQMQSAERERLKRALIFGNQIECVGTKIDMALFNLLAAKVTEQ